MALASGARASLTGPGRKPTKEGARPQQSGADGIDDLVEELLRLPDSPEPENQHGSASAPAPQPLQGGRQPRSTNRGGGRLQAEMLVLAFRNSQCQCPKASSVLNLTDIWVCTGTATAAPASQPLQQRRRLRRTRGEAQVQALCYCSFGQAELCNIVHHQ